MILPRRSVWLLLVACSLALGDDADKASSAWEEFWSQPEGAQEPARQEALLEAIDQSPSVLARLIRTDKAYQPFESGWNKRTFQLQTPDKEYQETFHFRVPKGYDPTKSYPILLACHGQGSNGRQIAAAYEMLLGQKVDQYILLAPTLPGPHLYTAQEHQERVYLQPLSWVQRNLNVDDSRVYISGYSIGGHSTWHLAIMYPRRFSAAVPMAGVPITQGTLTAATLYLENLEHLPLWHIWAEFDRTEAGRGNVDLSRVADKRMRQLKSRHYRGTEVKGVGHHGAWPESGKAFRDFLDSARRNPAPESFTRHFSLRHHARGYYVEATRLSHPPIDLSKPLKVRLQTSRMPTSEEFTAAARAMIAKKMFSFHVQALGRENAVKIRSPKVLGVRVFLLQGLLDLERPVGLVLNARQWRARVPVSASCMLEHYARYRDAEAIVQNVVELDASGQVKILYPGR